MAEETETRKRDKHGRFIKGSAGGPGRPPKTREEEYLGAIYEVVPLERWKKIIEAVARRAERGDLQAFNALANRLSPVIEKKEHTGEGGGPLEIVVSYVGDADEIPAE